ncbi:hypothetical protein KIW_00015 [Pediococcus acidilactici MA18/5M]|nr:hypothetical protein KIW_00015 [Pediococcus acidilactici MA18/5M]
MVVLLKRSARIKPARFPAMKAKRAPSPSFFRLTTD